MEAILNIDFGILDFFQTLHCDVLDFIMKCLTYAGEKGYIWIGVCIVLLCIPKTRKIGIYLAVTLVLEYILNDMIVKHIIRRNRPFLHRTAIDTIIKKPTSYSFPSGHSSAAFSSATAIFLHDKKKGICAYVLAFLIAISRLYFYVHFPTDVLCGSLFGILIGFAVNRIGRYIEKKYQTRKNNNTEKENAL